MSRMRAEAGLKQFTVGFAWRGLLLIDREVCSGLARSHGRRLLLWRSTRSFLAQ